MIITVDRKGKERNNMKERDENKQLETIGEMKSIMNDFKKRSM